MHASEVLHTAEFKIEKDGEPQDLWDIFPGFRHTEKLGIVSVTPGDAMRAAPLLCAAIGAFYEDVRRHTKDFYVYPNFFMFHVGGGLHGYHSPLEIWPQTREVEVENDPQALLAALNDRGITRLILPTAPGAEGRVMLHAAQLAKRRFRTVVTTSNDPEREAWTVAPSDNAASMTVRCARNSRPKLGDERTDYWMEHAGRPQSYKLLSTDEALSAICAVGEGDGTYGFSEEYLTNARLNTKHLNRDTYTVRSS